MLDKIKKYYPFVVLFIGFLTFAILLTTSLLNRYFMKEIFARGTYYFMFVIFIGWIVQMYFLLRKMSFSWQPFFNKNYPGLIAALVLATVIFAASPPKFRVLSDETNLLTISKSMHFEKTIYNITMGKYYYDNFNPTNYELPRMPLIFPFAVHLIHNFIGYHYWNIFILNFIMLVAMLFTIYVIVNKFASKLVGLAAMLFVASYPVVTIYATTGCFDLFSSYLFFLSLICVFLFLKSPSAEALGFLWATLLMFSNVRYESFLAAIVILAGLVIYKYVKWEYLKKNIILISLTLPLCLPLIWQKIFSSGQYGNPPGVELFAIKHIFVNLGDLLRSQTRFDFHLPYANILTFLGLFSFCYLAYLWVRGRHSFKEQKFFRIFTIIAIMSFGVVQGVFLLHFGGTSSHPTQARYFMILMIICALLPVLVKIFQPKIIPDKVILLVAAVIFILYNSVASEGRFANSLVLDRATWYSYDFLLSLNERRLMVIDNRPGQYTALNFGAVNFGYANKNSDTLLRELKNKLYSEIIVQQWVDYATDKPQRDFELDPVFKLEPLRKTQITATEYLRISRVVVDR